MPYAQTKSTDGKDLNLFYDDLGIGKTIVFIHGWPLNHMMWEYQMANLPAKDFRCIAYDRRGFGKSDKPWDGYDYDTLAGDLKNLLDELNLENVTLVGFSMGGGEVTRYLSLYGNHRVAKAILVSSVTPYMLLDESNTKGIPAEQFQTMAENISQDRPKFLAEFNKTFFGQGLIGSAVSQEVLSWTFNLGLEASQRASLECLKSFSETDFTKDLNKIDIPTLVIHGDADKTVPFNLTGARTAQLVKNAELLTYKYSPHGLYFTDKDRLNKDIMTFVNES